MAGPGRPAIVVAKNHFVTSQLTLTTAEMAKLKLELACESGEEREQKRRHGWYPSRRATALPAHSPFAVFP